MSNLSDIVLKSLLAVGQQQLTMRSFSIGIPVPSQQSTQSTLSLITDLNQNDVLFGRGTPCNINEGNIRFRELIKQHSDEYRSVEKRLRKDGIARAIIRQVQERGGRFLEKADYDGRKEKPLHEGRRSGWTLADDEEVLRKVKQALRGKKASQKHQSSKAIRKHQTDKSIK